MELFKFAACTRSGFLPGLYDNLPCDGNGVTFSNLSDLWIVIGNIIRILVALAGSLAVIFIIVGAIYYIVSTGDPGRIKRAKEIVTEAITGLIICIIAYSVITFIASHF